MPDYDQHELLQIQTQRDRDGETETNSERQREAEPVTETDRITEKECCWATTGKAHLTGT